MLECWCQRRNVKGEVLTVDVNVAMSRATCLNVSLNVAISRAEGEKHTRACVCCTRTQGLTLSTWFYRPPRARVCIDRWIDRSDGRIRPQSGSLTSLVWTPDGTQLAAAGGNGSVVFGQVIERSIEWDNFEVHSLPLCWFA